MRDCYETLLNSGPCRARGQGHKALFQYYHIVLYTLPEGILEGRAVRGDDGREGKRSDYCQRTTEQVYILLCDVVRATLSQLLSAQRRLPESRLVPLVTTGRSSWST